MSQTADPTSFNPLTIRPYTESDWPAVCRIHDAARIQELAAGQVDPRAFWTMAAAAAGDEFFVSTTLVACIDGGVAGFISWRDAYITWLYVDPALQRRGIGRQLLAEALRRIGPEAWTNSLAGNEAALRLYLQAGMEIVWQKPFDCDGYPCEGLRLALPTSRMRDPLAKRIPAPAANESAPS